MVARDERVLRRSVIVLHYTSRGADTRLVSPGRLVISIKRFTPSSTSTMIDRLEKISLV